MMVLVRLSLVLRGKSEKVDYLHSSQPYEEIPLSALHNEIPLVKMIMTGLFIVASIRK